MSSGPSSAARLAFLAEMREAGDRKREEAKAMTLATELGRARDQGIASAAVVIGGPDGSETVFWHPLRSRSPLER
jgi:hypothetical protein